ncbi:MAG: NADH-quinone oxidoreductase subunit NuoE [Candidatus Eisenbacteria bacterium]|nr:NADH-quinone oxidoreductase subunit NuoE [Candidatus Eisenbacteria bacterium]
MPAEAALKILSESSGRRGDLIPLLQRVQEIDGYISPETIRTISKRLRISENEVYGVATFYAQFRFRPPGEHSIQVCMGTACHVRGGEQLSAFIQHRLGIGPGQTTPDNKFDLELVACLGCCALSPVVKIDDKIYSQMSVLKLRDVLDEYENAG